MERDSLICRVSVKAQMNTGVTGLGPIWRKRRIQTRTFQKQFEPMSGGRVNIHRRLTENNSD